MDLGYGDIVMVGNGIVLVFGMNFVLVVVVGCVVRYDWGNCGGWVRCGCVCCWRWSYVWNVNVDVVVELQIVVLCVDLCVLVVKLGD